MRKNGYFISSYLVHILYWRDVDSSDILGSSDILTVDLIKWTSALILWLLMLRHQETQKAI